MSRRRRFSSLVRRASRVWLTLAVLCGVAAGTVGFPVTPPGLLGGAFPCQGHGCGCRSAEECWLGCCCLTAAQRLAWAKQRGVTPPAELVELAQQEALAKEVASCCAGHGAACCHHGKACCTAKAIAHSEKNPEGESPGFGFTTPHCRGFIQWWAAAGQPLALPERGVAISAGAISAPVVTASTDYAFLTSPPPARPG